MDSDAHVADGSYEQEASAPDERVADNDAKEVVDMTERRTESYIYEAIEQPVAIQRHRIRARPTRSMGSIPTVEAFRTLRLHISHFNQIDQERRLGEYAS